MKNFQLNFITNKETVRWLKILHTFERIPTRSVKELAQFTKALHERSLPILPEFGNIFSSRF